MYLSIMEAKLCVLTAIYDDGRGVNHVNGVRCRGRDVNCVGREGGVMNHVFIGVKLVPVCLDSN